MTIRRYAGRRTTSRKDRSPAVACSQASDRPSRDRSMVADASASTRSKTAS